MRGSRITGVVSFCGILLTAALSSAQTQHFTDVSVTTTGTVRVVTQPTVPNPDAMVLESSDALEGPWMKEAGSLRTNAPGGYEFRTPQKAYSPERYYRLAPLGSSRPYIRLIAPNKNARPGGLISLLGANFSPTPGGNTVKFDLPTQSYAATVLQAATNLLVIRTPTNLPGTNANNGLVYRVTVTTTNGTGNGVGCAMYTPSFGDYPSLRPAQAYLIRKPAGTGRETLVIGGGYPPYSLVPLTAGESNIVVATLNGSLLEVMPAVSNVAGYSGFTVKIKDSSNIQAQAGVTIGGYTFTPTMTTIFHTLEAGTAPGFTMTSRFDSYQPEQLEMRLQNVQVDLSKAAVGDILALVKLYYSSSVYGYQHLVVREVKSGRVKFDAISLADGGETLSAQGELVQNPPTLVLNALGQKAGSLMPTTVDQEIVFSDGIFRLPAGAGAVFRLTNTFTSVSASEEKYTPQQRVIGQAFTNTTIAAGAPRIERILPVQGEVNHLVRLVGTNFSPVLANNQVTFAGMDSNRVAAVVVSLTTNELTVAVPWAAISGPVRVVVAGKTSNDFLFFVRFHPDVTLVFNGCTNNVPTAPRILFQQPVDDLQTIGEVPVQTITTFIDKGRLVVTNLILNQLVGTATNVNGYSGAKGGWPLVYAGQETNSPFRYKFDVPTSVGSSTILFRIFAQNTGADGVSFEINGVYLPFNAGNSLDYCFTAPVYRPLATPGTDLSLRLESVSQKWNSLPGTEMKVIRTVAQPVN